MSQTDLNVANASGAVVRADINDHLQALATNNSGATAPTTTFPHQWWFDESTNDLNQRNAGNTAWVLVARKDGSGWTPYRQTVLVGILSTKNSNVLAKTAAYTVVVADDGKLVDADATSAAFSVTLPTVASAGDGFIISVKKTDSTANAVTVDAAGAELIDSALTKVLANQFDSVVLYCDGLEWHIASDVAVGGDITGPASATDRSIALYNGTTGKTIKDGVALGSSGQVLTSNGAGADPTFQAAAGGPAQATKAAIEAETNENTYLPPDLLKHNPGVAKAWANFNDASTVAGSQNVSSVTDVGIGNWRVNLTTSFSGTGYSAGASGDKRSDAPGPLTWGTESLLVGSFVVRAQDTITDLTDDPGNSGPISAWAFGDQ